MIIKDNCLAPWFIQLESSSYMVYKAYKPKKKDGTIGDEQKRFVSSHSNLIDACYKIASLQVEHKGKKKDAPVAGLVEFLREVRIIKTEMLKITHDNLEQRLLKIERSIRLLSNEQREQANKPAPKTKHHVLPLTEDQMINSNKKPAYLIQAIQGEGIEL